MGIAEKSVVTFRIFGPDLDPDEITRLLKCEPDRTARKGESRIIQGKESSYIEKQGGWRLSAPDRTPEDIPAQINEILVMLESSADIWASLSSRYEMDMFCGVFMSSSNDGLEFPPSLLAELASRGIALNLDVYEPTD